MHLINEDCVCSNHDQEQLMHNLWYFIIFLKNHFLLKITFGLLQSIWLPGVHCILVLFFLFFKISYEFLLPCKISSVVTPEYDMFRAPRNVVNCSSDFFFSSFQAWKGYPLSQISFYGYFWISQISPEYIGRRWIIICH